MAGRGAWRRDGGAWRAETTWRHRRLPRLRMPSHIALQCADASLLPPCPSGRCWRRRRHRTCVHRRARWCAPPWGTQRRTRHCRITTVSSTCSFHRRGRRRRRLRGRQAAGRGTTFGAGCAAQRAKSTSRQHARALSAIDPCCGHELARLGSPSAAPPVQMPARRLAARAPPRCQSHHPRR
jgi:hypothetical protein